MSSFSHGEYTVVNKDKYVGKLPVIYRSSWELSFMRVLDLHPNVLNWASESLSIPYLNPVTGASSMYIPDFLVVYVDKNGNKSAEVIEIKPSSQAILEKAKSKKDKLAYAVNQAKWQSAQVWCQKHGLTFKVMTEEHLFSQPKKRSWVRKFKNH